ncbi:MAG: hypothetical protein M1378_10545 [Bacteroidetes bacterium]|nr:hypothetical protein [Bacteroidota bacterium]
MRRIVIVVLFLGTIFLFFGRTANSQTKEAGGKQLSVYTSNTHRFTISYHGTLIKKSSDEYVVKPAALNGMNDRNEVHIFVTRRPFVYLPGTYGGRYYFDASPNSNGSSDFARGDSVTVNGLRFARDYWAVYAGMGQWETVDNCYALQDGQYYTISLTRDFNTAMPGAKVNGVATSKAQMRAGLIERMRDSTNVYVRSFNQVLRSFSITK